PQTNIDDRRIVLEHIASAISAEGTVDRKPAAVEVVQYENVVDKRGELVEQPARRGHAHPLGAHDRDVEALLQLRGLHERMESFLLDEKDIVETVLWPTGREQQQHFVVGCLEGRALVEVLPHLKGAKGGFRPSVRLGEMTAGIPSNVPVGAVVFLHV